MNVVLLEEARRRFEAEDEWWRAHRDAQEISVEEFHQALASLSEMPARSQRYRRVRGKTQCHVYYAHDRELDVVEIHSVWGARRERGPAL